MPAAFRPKPAPVLGTPPSKQVRHQRKNTDAYPSPPASQRRRGGPGIKEIEFSKKMQDHPNEIKTQYVTTDLPEKNKWPVESEEQRIKAVQMRKAKERLILKDRQPIAPSLKSMMKKVEGDMPSDELMAVAPNLFWDGGNDMSNYYGWLEEFYDGDMPEIVRRANAFRGFPQLDDEDVNPEGAAERRTHYRSQKGRDELRPYLPAIQEYASKGEYALIEAQVNGQAASYAMAAAAAGATAATTEPKHEDPPTSSSSATSPKHESPAGLAILRSAPAAEKLSSSQFDRSGTIGRTPIRFDESPSLFVSAVPGRPAASDGVDPESAASFVPFSELLQQMRDEMDAEKEIKQDSPVPAASSIPVPTSSGTTIKKDEEGEDEEEDKEMSAAADLLHLPVDPATPAPTPPSKKTTKASRKRKELSDATFKPSGGGDMSSSEDEKPLSKRTKPNQHMAGRRRAHGNLANLDGISDVD